MRRRATRSCARSSPRAFLLRVCAAGPQTAARQPPALHTYHRYAAACRGGVGRESGGGEAVCGGQTRRRGDDKSQRSLPLLSQPHTPHPHPTPQTSCYCAERWTPTDGATLPPSLRAAPGGAPGATDSADEAAARGSYSLRAPTPAELAWAGLSCDVLDAKSGTHKTILHPTAGAVVPGELAALVGPSGAGKSTLLDMLARRKTTGRLSGAVLMNGRPVGRTFKRVSAYVAQEDVFVPTLSAAETLHFHARLRAERGTPARALASRIEAVLDAMGLARAASTAVGGLLPSGQAVRGLSGGERRRLTIACSLVALPSILFLDEPTTGLDSFAAYNIMEHMAKLAAGGHTVIATIHQPRQAIWDMFHKVCVLSEGRQLFFGAPDKAATWFDRTLGYEYNALRDGAVSDWLMDLVSVGFAKPASFAARSMTTVEDVDAAASAWAGTTLEDSTDAALVALATAGGAKPPRPSSAGGGVLAHVASAASLVDVKPVNGAALTEQDKSAARSRAAARKRLAHHYPSSYWTQFLVLLRRSSLAQLRNPTDVSSRLLLSTWVGTIAGAVFVALSPGPTTVFQRLAILFFTMMIFELLPFCYMSLYVADRAFYAADVAAGLYHPCAYYIAHSLAAAPFIILNTLVGGYSAYGLAALTNRFRNIAIYGALQALQGLCAVQMMVLAVYLTPNQDVAYVLAIAYVSLSILLGGFYIRISEVPFKVLRYMSYLSCPRFALQGLAINELTPDNYQGVPNNCLSGGMLGATDAEIDSLVNNANATRQQAMDGQSCQFVYNGKDALKFWDFNFSLATCFGALIGFLAFFHVASYIALRTLYKARR